LYKEDGYNGTKKRSNVRASSIWKDVTCLSSNLATEKRLEASMVDLSYGLLRSKGEPMLYRDIMNEVAKLKGFTEEKIDRYITQLYTEINIDGRFVCVGRGLWGIRDWYPTEQATDSAVAANVKDDYLGDDTEDELYQEEVYDSDHLSPLEEMEEDTYHGDSTDTFEEDGLDEDGSGDDEEEDEL
jgi:DNA-directed RNA polymerase subunit delta